MADDSTHKNGFRPRHWFPSGAILVLFFVLRFPHVNHLLSFDEAWNALAIRAMAQNAESPFAFNFWRHPPLYMLLGEILAGDMAQAAPLLTSLSLLLNGLMLVALFCLAKRTWGLAAGFWTMLAYTLLPNAIFYDTWIKRDCVVTLLGILAVTLFIHRRHWLAGSLLGLAFLGKETAVFYAQALFWLALFSSHPRRELRNLCKTATPCILIAAWWYVILWKGGGDFFVFFRGGSAESDAFAQPFWYYFAGLPRTVSWPGLVLLTVGTLRLLSEIRLTPRSTERLWPLFLVFPSLLLASLSNGKPPWMMITLLPGLAALIGMGAWTVHQAGTRLFQKLAARRETTFSIVPNAALTALLVACLLPPWTSYFDWLKRESYGTAMLAYMSHRMAETLNTLTEPEDRILLTDFYYMKGKQDPVFHYYVEPRSVAIVSRNRTAEEILRFAREYELDWALLSPGPRPASHPLVRNTARITGRAPLDLGVAVLFKLPQ